MKQAFSLVELSIVLVILGLLTGGVLTGQSLIKAAELRKVTTDVSAFQTASNTFKGKYFALAGDLSNAASFWPGDTTNGDGDGIIEVTAAASTAMESFEFWNQLALSGMMSGEFTGVSGPDSTSGRDQIPGTNVPESSIASAGFAIFTADWDTVSSTSRYAYNYVNALGIGSRTSSGRLTEGALTPEEAWNIDTKIDDGEPALGSVHAVNWDDECSEATTGTTERDNFDANYRLEDTTTQCGLHFVNLF